MGRSAGWKRGRSLTPRAHGPHTVSVWWTLPRSRAAAGRRCATGDRNWPSTKPAGCVNTSPVLTWWGKHSRVYSLTQTTEAAENDSTGLFVTNLRRCLTFLFRVSAVRVSPARERTTRWETTKRTKGKRLLQQTKETGSPNQSSTVSKMLRRMKWTLQVFNTVISFNDGMLRRTDVKE